LKIERFIQLNDEYSGFIADIGNDIVVEDKGLILIVIDFFREIKSEDLTIIPCRVLVAHNYYSEWVIKNKNIILKKYDFLIN
jgi:hypothetical protein